MDTSFNNTIAKISNDPFFSSDLNRANSNYLEKIIMKNKVNKIIKIYRNFHKRREFSTKTSTRNNTDRIQGNNYIINLLNSNNNIINSNNDRTMKIHNIIQKNNNSCTFLGTKDELGRKNGFGIQKWDDNSKFSCIFETDQVKGWGIFIHGDGDIYKGEYLNNITNGYGEYYRQNIAIYKGYWLNDSQYGIGSETWNDQSEYYGEYNAGKKEGIGTYTWADDII